ncbi:unnamed protein product [Blepharisma stoltei]|uniref:Uncharacterized protein n=1 Tax=Blepharisma stoltei TaxID=1481888 RepID=A0AAU9JI87_9CILI|nr:unnamed protein product [Blepharisma stoltei]
MNSGIISLDKKNDKNIESLPQLTSPKYALIKKALSPRIMINSSTLLLSPHKESNEKGLIYSNKRHESLSTIITSDVSDQSMPKLNQNETKFNFSTISSQVKESLSSRRQNRQFSNISADIGDTSKNKNLYIEELNPPLFSSFSKETDAKSPKNLHSPSISFDKKWYMDSPVVKLSILEGESPKQRTSLGVSRYPYIDFSESQSRKSKKEASLINIHTHLMKSKSKKHRKFNSYYKATKEKINLHLLNEQLFQDLNVKKL